MKDTFIKYANSVPENGSVILCYDDENARSLLPHIDRPYVTYGTNENADFRISDIKYGNGSHFVLSFNNSRIGTFSIAQVGLHNVLNATAALVTAYLLHLDMKSAGMGVKAFSGVERRFELRHQKNSVLFYDDYAHHPTEINATLNAVRTLFPERRLVAIFQPHLYSRTRDFADGFASSLQKADKVFIADIYPAREKPIRGINSNMIVKMMKDAGFQDVQYAGKLKDVPGKVLPEIKKNDIVMTIGAGDIWQVADMIYEDYK
jgi:UDP-N-acetylmuramate--alanine ligase